MTLDTPSAPLNRGREKKKKKRGRLTGEGKKRGGGKEGGGATNPRRAFVSFSHRILGGMSGTGKGGEGKKKRKGASKGEGGRKEGEGTAIAPLLLSHLASVRGHQKKKKEGKGKKRE